jgi:hypothetical protein
MSVENIHKSVEGRISFLMTNSEDQFNTNSSAQVRCLNRMG